MYRYLLFDLDRTLWDFDGNADITFREMFGVYRLQELCGVDYKEFHDYYRAVNDVLWEQYRAGTLAKEVLHVRRFMLPLEHFGCTPDRVSALTGCRSVAALSLHLGDYYVNEGPRQTGLMPGARHLLDYLAGKSCYELDIITNGFSEAQLPKMHSSDIYRYFRRFFLSEDLGHHKPDPRFFEAVLQQLSVRPEECLVIGDDFAVDMAGARRVGIPQLFYNRERRYQGPYPFRPTMEVSSLCDIERIL